MRLVCQGVHHSNLFTFEPPLAPDTGHAWTDASTYKLTVGGSGGGTVDDLPLASGGSPRLVVGVTTVAVLPGTIRSAAAKRLADTSGAPTPAADFSPEARLTLSGTFGSGEPPRLVSFVPSDPLNGDEVFGSGDQLQLYAVPRTGRDSGARWGDWPMADWWMSD